MVAVDPQSLLLLPHIHIENANTISSPLTWGFPAVSAFTGFTHALQRRIAAEMEIELDGVGIVCHQFQAQISQPAGKRTHVFRLTRNPIDKDGSTAAIVEEGRAHLEVSLVIGARGDGLYSGADPQTVADRIWEHVMSMRIAGGGVRPSTGKISYRHRPELMSWPATFDERRQLSRKIAFRLLPGFSLVSREDQLEQHLASLRTKQPDVTAVDALLDLSRLNIDPPDILGNQVPRAEWGRRQKSGWLVPIPVGYAALSPLYRPGEVKNARDRSMPFRFVECLFGLGEWISPHRIKDITQLLWYHCAQPDAGLYRWTTPFFASQVVSE